MLLALASRAVVIGAMASGAEHGGHEGRPEAAMPRENRGAEDEEHPRDVLRPQADADDDGRRERKHGDRDPEVFPDGRLPAEGGFVTHVAPFYAARCSSVLLSPNGVLALPQMIRRSASAGTVRKSRVLEARNPSLATSGCTCFQCLVCGYFTAFRLATPDPSQRMISRAFCVRNVANVLLSIGRYHTSANRRH